MTYRVGFVKASRRSWDRHGDIREANAVEWFEWLAFHEPGLGAPATPPSPNPKFKQNQNNRPKFLLIRFVFLNSLPESNRFSKSNRIHGNQNNYPADTVIKTQPATEKVNQNQHEQR